MNIVFMGTPEFAVPSLEAMINNHNVVGVFTQPDRPKGRGKKLAFSAVKEVAVKHNIDVYQPEKLRSEREYIDKLKELAPDFIIVVAYGQILPKEVLDIPKYACINLHGSLLPKYRGAAPLNWAIIDGEKVSGNTTMLMDVALDEGDMLLKQEVEITENMTAGQLHDILMVEGGKLLLETIDKFVKGDIIPEKQDDSLSNYASMLSKETGKINWNKTAMEIHNLVRGVNPWPIATTIYNNQVVKIYETTPLDEKCNETPGTILRADNDGIRVATGDKVLLIKKIQFPNKKPLEVKEYLKGNSIEEKVVLI